MDNRVTKVTLPEKDDVDFYFVISDIHTEYYCRDSFKIFLQHVKLVPREMRRLVIAGDFLDCEHLMGKPGELKKMSKNIDLIEGHLIPETEKEFEWGNWFLDEMQKEFDYIYLIFGNHCCRYAKWRENYCPYAYRSHFDVSVKLDLEKRGIPVIDYPDYLDIGELTITHGCKHGASHLKQMYDMVGRNVLYGHLHRHESKAFAKRGHSTKAWSLPCMCNLAPEYQKKNGENNWTNGYATFGMRSSGQFNLHIHEIFNGVLVLPDGTKITAS